MRDSLPARKFTPAELEKWRQSIFNIYKRMRAKAQELYEIEYGGFSLVVLPNVYAPEFFDDSLWFAKQLSDIVGEKSLLEIGTGTGIIALFCAKNGARVVATDINPAAIKNARINAIRNNLNISVREGNLYEPLKPDEKFDFIFWAHPFNNWELTENDILLRSGIDPGYKSLRGYIAGAKKYLTENGKLLLGTGDSADLNMINEIAVENNYTMKLLAEIDIPLEPDSNAKIKDLIYEFVSTF